MILVDDRIGSKELAEHLPEAVLTTLEYGDVLIDGLGESGSLLIGIERKRLQDFINSSLSGRLQSHQLPGMLEMYDVCYLVIEGTWVVGKGGLLFQRKGGKCYPLECGSRRFTMRDIWEMVNSLTILGGLHVWTTANIKQTCYAVQGLAKWWSKPWEKHQFHLHFTKRFPTKPLCRPSTLQRFAAQLPGVGVKLSSVIAKNFDTVSEMVLADEATWASIPGIGKIGARRIVRALQQ